MTYAEAIAKLEEIDAKLVREGDPDLRDLPITEGQRKWLLHLGLSRALEVLKRIAGPEEIIGHARMAARADRTV